MDFNLQQEFTRRDSLPREAIILACYSKNYFSSHLKSTGAAPLLWTTGLMAPEAYTLHDALREWIAVKPAAEIRSAAANAYAAYQHCSLKASKNLLVSGW
jgi:hypothetical protein